MNRPTSKQYKKKLSKLAFKDLEAGGAKFSQLKNPPLPLRSDMCKKQLESSVAEHCKVKFVKSPSSEVIKVVPIV